MSELLRPLDLGEILDRTVQIYRSRFLVLLGIETIPTGTLIVIVGAIALFFSWAGKSTSSSSTADPALVFFAGVFLVLLALFILVAFTAVYALGMAAMNHAAAAINAGRGITIRGAYQAAWQRGWRYIGLFLLQGFITWGIPAAASIVLLMLLPITMAFAGAGSSASVLFGFLFFLLFAAVVVYLILAVIRLSLAFPACIVEQQSVWESIKRGNSLSAGTRGRIFLLYLLVWVLDRILSMAVLFPTILLLALLPGMKNPDQQQTLGTVFMLVFYGAALLVQAFTRPVTGVALMLFYYDQRIRKEGYDIEWLMQQAGLVVPVAAQAEAVPWTAAVRSVPQEPVAADTATAAAQPDIPDESAPDAMQAIALATEVKGESSVSEENL
jgi:hypothetical protein